MIRLWLLIHLLIFLLPAVGTSLVLPAVGFALVLPAVAPVLPAVSIISHLLTRIQFSEYRHPSSAFSATSCCVRQCGVAGFLLLVSTGAVGRGSFTVLCLNSLTAHRGLSLLCVARRLLASCAFHQRHFVAVYDSVVRFWLLPTPLLSIAPLRDCLFTVGALDPREGSLQQPGLLFVRIVFSLG